MQVVCSAVLLAEVQAQKGVLTPKAPNFQYFERWVPTIAARARAMARRWPGTRHARRLGWTMHGARRGAWRRVARGVVRGAWPRLTQAVALPG